jgi:hypothetical protein
MQGSQRANEHRASPPQLPETSPAFDRDRKAFETYRTDREKTERRSVVRGLILLAVLVVFGSIVHAGLDRTFVQGWWRP